MDGTLKTLLLLLIAAELFEEVQHDFSLADVLHFLEIFSRIFDHELETARVVHPVLLVDEFIDTASYAPPLVGRQYENL